MSIDWNTEDRAIYRSPRSGSGSDSRSIPEGKALLGLTRRRVDRRDQVMRLLSPCSIQPSIGGLKPKRLVFVYIYICPHVSSDRFHGSHPSSRLSQDKWVKISTSIIQNKAVSGVINSLSKIRNSFVKSSLDFDRKVPDAGFCAPMHCHGHVYVPDFKFAVIKMYLTANCQCLLSYK